MKTRIQNRTAVATFAAFLTFFPATAQEQRTRERPQPGNYYSAQSYETKRPMMPPLPFNPFPELPVYAIGERAFIYDDRSVDYEALRREAAEREAAERAAFGGALAEGGDGGAGLMSPASGGIRLEIERTDLDGKRVSFNTEAGLIYHLESSSNLFDWSVLQTFVANDTNAYSYTFEPGIRFYRVRQDDDRIQFPDWEDFIEQYAHFDVWTSIQGTYHLELYGDGALLYQTTQAVPASGFFGVYDGSYDPSQWPFTGYYAINDWELRVSVTPTAAGPGEGPAAQPAQATVKKKQRRRNQNRIGVTVQQYNAFTISFLIQDEIDHWMHNYFLANIQASFQVALDGSNLNEFTDPSGVPRLISTNDWNNLKNLIYGTNGPLLITDLHYFGHGTNTHIGSTVNPNRRISRADLTNSLLLATNPMRYVGLDGCRTAQTTDFLRAWVGQGKQVDRQTFIDKGWDPVFAWGWKNNKSVAYVRQGVLYDEHFWYVGDYYWFLTQRDFGGFMQNTYKQAIMYGQNPNNPLSPSAGQTTRNREGDSINYVGCFDCFFDVP
jgi:hypothetical protein